MKSSLPTIGWREWLVLPELDIPWIKAKVDTGARSSALHATDIETVTDDKQVKMVQFVVAPRQRSNRGAVQVVAPLLGTRVVRSSSGTVEERPLIETVALVGEISISLELTLTQRDDMGFRMLLGRQAVRRQFLVNPARSYLGARPSRKVVAQNWRMNGKKIAQ